MQSFKVFDLNLLFDSTPSVNAEMVSHSMRRVPVLISTNAEQTRIFAMKMHRVTMRSVAIHVDATMDSMVMDTSAHRHQKPKPNRSMSQSLPHRMQSLQPFQHHTFPDWHQNIGCAISALSMLDANKACASVMMAGMEVALNAHTIARTSHSGRLIIAKQSPAKKSIVIISKQFLCDFDENSHDFHEFNGCFTFLLRLC